MKEFKSSYFYKNSKVLEQSILIFDEAQRVWVAEKLGRGFTEPEGLLPLKLPLNRGRFDNGTISKKMYY